MTIRRAKKSMRLTFGPTIEVEEGAERAPVFVSLGLPAIAPED
jgi:hypothetical protein